jgi:hypothetical protein
MQRKCISFIPKFIVQERNKWEGRGKTMGDTVSVIFNSDKLVGYYQCSKDLL